MNHFFKPKSYREAWGYFISAPSYRFSDMVQKNEIVFSRDEIITISKKPDSSGFSSIYYKNNSHYGYFIHMNVIDVKSFEPIDFHDEAAFSLSYSKEFLLSFFSLYSPVLWSILFTFIFGTICIEYRASIFPGYSKPELFANAYCSVKCVRLASMAWAMLLLILGTIFGNLFISFFFFFRISSNIKNAQKYFFVKIESLILIFVCLGMTKVVIEGSSEKNNFKKAVIAYRLAYTPEYFKNSINRKIASEIMGVEIKEKKGFK